MYVLYFCLSHPVSPLPSLRLLVPFLQKWVYTLHRYIGANESRWKPPADQSRKRGTLESDLLLSTFAATYLPTMTVEQMAQYDLFLDENDWDIYYWVTQPIEPPSKQNDSASSAGKDTKLEPAQPAKGEWAQTIGTFKPAYRPVPARWRDSEILELLRAHVKARSAAGVLGNNDRDKAEGMAFMPALGERK